MSILEIYTINSYFVNKHFGPKRQISFSYDRMGFIKCYCTCVRGCRFFFKSGAKVIKKNRCRLDLTKINGEGTTI